MLKIMNKKIVVIGSSNVDLMMKMHHLPKVGESVADATFMQTFGGKGANQAVAAARAGGDVVFVSCVGDDTFAPIMIENFKHDGLNVDYVFTETGISTGTALGMIDRQGENYLSVAPGANYRLTSAYIDRALDAIKETGFIVLQYEIPAETLKYTIDLAQKLNKKVIWNFAPAREFDLAYLSKVYMLVVNETEAEFLCGIKIEHEEQAKEAVEALMARGPEIIILTLGADGSYIAHSNVRKKIPAFQVKAVDTVAAGDVYCGSLVVALNEGNSLEEAVQFAGAASAISVTRMGAQPSIPTRAEIDEFLSKHVMLS
jgi:ribokinase